MKRALVLLTGLVALCALSPALAQSAAAPAEASLPATAKQHALAVRLERAGDEVTGLRAQACAAASCSASEGELITFPEDVDGRAAIIETVKLDTGRFAALVRAPLADGARGRFVVVLWPSAKGEGPLVNSLSGHFDTPKGGLEGEQKTSVLLREPTPTGEKLMVGTSYENVTVCDRPALMAMKWLDPSIMRFTPVGARALDAEARQSAIAIDANRMAEPLKLAAPRALSPRLASSAVSRSVKHAADRELSTRWAEAKPGAGSGEFVVMTASPEVAIEAFEIVVRGTDEGEASTAPKRFYLALSKEIFVVTMPEDAMDQPPGTVYEIVLPEPVRTDCVTVVLEEGHGADGEVGFAELRARTSFDASDATDLVAALEGDQREQAKALLLRGGPEATEAAMKGYRGLDAEGRDAALEVIAAGTCDVTTRFYAGLVVGEGREKESDFDPALDRLAGHGRDRLRGCRSQAVATFTAMVDEAGPAQRRVWAARELVDLDPAGSITTILDVLTEGSKAPKAPGGGDDVRRGLRGALAIAARHRRGQNAVKAALAPDAFARRSLVERIDLLRAIGPGLPAHEAARPALEQVLASDASFRTRYLLLPPAAVLAVGGHQRSIALLKKSLADAEPALRARAAAVSGAIPALAPALARALDDDNPRVRAAALESLAEGATADLGPRIIPLLESDPWTFVRSGAANALAGMPRSKASDAALVAAIDDASHLVRRAALRAIGKRRQIEAGERVQEVADDARAPTDTRVAAIAALGALCRHDAVDLLTKLALRAGFQQLPYDQPLGLAALDALGDLQPPDLRQRLAPLLARNARIPTPIRRIAHGVLQRPGRCGGTT